MRLPNTENQIEILNEGKKSVFWKIIVSEIDKQLEDLNNLEENTELWQLPAEEYKLRSEILKTEKKNLNKIKCYPEVIIGILGTPEPQEENFDPYEK